MKITVVCVIVGIVAAFVCNSHAQIGGPGLGWAIGQQASVNAVSLAIDGALAKADPATLPPELQVNEMLMPKQIWARKIFRSCDHVIVQFDCSYLHIFCWRLCAGGTSTNFR